MIVSRYIAPLSKNIFMVGTRSFIKILNKKLFVQLYLSVLEIYMVKCHKQTNADNIRRISDLSYSNKFLKYHLTRL